MKSFAEISWLEYPSMYFRRVKDEILSRGKDYILKVDEEEYISYLVDKYSIEPLSIISESEQIGEPKKSKERKNDMFGSQYECDCFTFTVRYNFIGHSELFKVQPNPHIWSSYDISVSGSTVSFSFKIYKLDPADFQRTKADCYSQAFTNLPELNKNLLEISNNIEQTIRSMFLQEKRKYKTENDFYSAINVKVNPDTLSVFTAPTIKKKDIPQPKISDNREFSSVPTMSQVMYNDILKVIYDSGKNMEKKPSLYINKDEEGLRDQFLFVLETRYIGTTASGETFNRSGKTDIILKFADDGSNLFVAECKFWHGASEFHNAISQLFDRYLTWRDSKVALIFFVQNQNFSNVIDTIKDESIKHPYFKKFIVNRGESSFTYLFQLPQDKEKDVQLEIMSFHYDKK